MTMPLHFAISPDPLLLMSPPPAFDTASAQTLDG